MQRQLRLGDILDDYCPRERRVTNHAVVAMVGSDVKQTRCSTCDTEHEYKHAKVPRQRRKVDTPAALYSQVVADAPKRPTLHDHASGLPAPIDMDDLDEAGASDETPREEPQAAPVAAAAKADESVATTNGNGPHTNGSSANADVEEDEDDAREDVDEGPVHRPLIRASLPRPEGQAPPQRPATDFTIRQPGGRPNRFRPRHQRGGQMFQGNRSGNMGGGSPRGGGGGGGMPRHGGNRPPMSNRRDGGGRKRSK
jgi:hypothetical protein